MEVPAPLEPPSSRDGKKKNGILKEQMKLLTGKTILAKQTKVLSQTLTHLHDQPVSPITPYAGLGTPTKALNTVKV